MKKLLASLFIIFSLSVLSGCAHSVPGELPNEKVSPTVTVCDLPQGVKGYADAEVFAGGEKLPVYPVMVNTSQNWTPNGYSRKENGVCLFQLDGSAEITVKPKTKINYASVVRPLSAKITPIANLQENTLSFTFKSAGEYVLEVNGDPYDAVHFFVSDTDEKGAGKYTGYKNVEIFSAGVHSAANDSRIDSNGKITLSSDTLVYLEDGAVVRGKFFAQNKSNIAIAGRGIIDGSVFERDAAKGSVTVPLEFNYCTSVLLSDFTVLDPAGWCVNFYFVENSRISDIKIITSRSNGDGISLQSCKQIDVDGCFVRTWDDALVVKNYPRWEDRSVQGATENISFSNCVLWADLAQCMELGYETVGVPFSDIKFENITVLHAMHKAVMSIHNANNAEIKRVTFKDITVEDGKKAADGAGLIDFRVLYSSSWSDQHAAPTALGNVDGVTVENVKVLSARSFTGTIGGCYDSRAGFEGARYVDNVTVRNVSLAGARPTFEECGLIVIQKYARSFAFYQDANAEVGGAQFVFSRSEDYLARFDGEFKVIKTNGN